MNWVTREEIEQEFAEAAEKGRKNHHEQVRVYLERRWWNEIGFTSLRPVYEIIPLAVEKVPCPCCGVECEKREGVKQLIHPRIGCRKAAA